MCDYYILFVKGRNMNNNFKISEELLSKVRGGTLDEITKQELRDSIDFFKASGVTLEFFIIQILDNFEDREEVEAYIRAYWLNGTI